MSTDMPEHDSLPAREFHAALISDRPLASRPRLPGPAAAVERGPLAGEPLGALEAAGFGGIHLETFGPSWCFRYDGVGLRELLAVGTKVGRGSPFDLTQTVVYRGPLRAVTDDAGNTYRRGELAAVGSPAAELHRAGPRVAQFTFLSPTAVATAAPSAPDRDRGPQS